MKKFSKAPLSMTVGMMMSVSFAANVAHADNNPFKLTELTQASLQVARMVPADTTKAGSPQTLSMPLQNEMRGNDER